MNYKIKIGLFGGTFAPPHLGHLHAVLTLIQNIELDMVLVMPTFLPPHKVKAGGDTPEQRLEMCESMFKGIRKVKVSDYEIKKRGVSYTVNTLEYLIEKYDAEIYLLCGSDMFMTLDTWFRAEDIFRLSKIICVPRDSQSMEELDKKKREYEKIYLADIRIIGSDTFEVSSTEIRRMIENGEDLTAYLPKEVIEIIKREKIYNGRTNDE